MNYTLRQTLAEAFMSAALELLEFYREGQKDDMFGVMMKEYKNLLSSRKKTLATSTSVNEEETQDETVEE